MKTKKEFECEYCGKVFDNKLSMQYHIGGKHEKGKRDSGKCVCKKCGQDLVKDQNWLKWAYTSGNHICRVCKNKMNLENYHRKKRNQG